MSLDMLLGVLVPRMLPLALLGLAGCVVPETVGDGDTESTETSGGDPSDGDGDGGSETDPALECFGLPDEASCMAAGCNEFQTVVQISDGCDCTPDVPACLQFTGGIGGSTSPDYFWHEATGTVAMFDTSWTELPVGWRRCTDDDAPAACECYEPFMGLACP